jgi:two-component system response regulator FixJ
MERVELLTFREREVMALVIDGHTNKSIAHELMISEKTVETHRARVMEKMCAKTLPHLVRMFFASKRQ